MFLHGDLEEEIYMEQPEGFTQLGKEYMVCKLKRSLYGLKQSPRQWYKQFDSYMIQIGYDRCDIIIVFMLSALMLVHLFFYYCMLMIYLLLLRICMML